LHLRSKVMKTVSQKQLAGKKSTERGETKKDRPKGHPEGKNKRQLYILVSQNSSMLKQSAKSTKKRG